MEHFKISVKLNVDKEQFISNQLNFYGVNYELMPIVYMTAPAEWKEKLLHEAPLNKTLFNSIILLFGFIPIDIHCIKLKDILDNGFKETSNSLLMKHWNHNRKIENAEHGCIVTDEISFSTRLPFGERILKPVYLLVFKHRHERLKKRFGRL